MNKIVNGVANDYEFPFLENTTENYYQVMNRYYTEEFVKQLQQELQRKDNNWNELKEFILNHYIVGHTVQNGSLDMIINKMKELENEEDNI